MGFPRIACCACVALLCCLAASTAQASKVLVMDEQGRVAERFDRFTLATGLPAPRTAAAQDRPAPAPAEARAAARRRTVAGELERLRAEGAIDDAAYAERRAAYADARRTLRRLKGARRVALAGVLASLDDVAARRELTPSRLPALWLTLEANRRWWTTGPLLAGGARVSFAGSELVWQHYPGQGIQIQVLGTAGKLNALAKNRRQDAATARLLDELLPLAAERAGGVAWEYYFPYAGGRAPWVSGMAQGTMLQALARAAVGLGREAEVWPVTSRGLTIFEAPPPAGVRVSAAGGPHYALYSFAPRLRVINGFVQSLIGLHDYGAMANDDRARTLFADGERRARVEVPTYDTGAWSLYSRVSVTRESDLGYHTLVRDFLLGMCERTAEPAYCDTAQRFTEYLDLPPELALRTTRLRGGTYSRIRLDLSKISALTLRIERAGKVVHSRFVGTLGYGERSLGWQVPRRAGEYTVTLQARDLAGNAGEATGTVEVLKARKPRRGT
jgi:hypothetical protein